ncbi:sensor histidine kinase [Deminuibacter soli]|uniref:histidine kinase n=1 Tax=Deminuibacter soli TaxID=2291815 RepID=A0A3E1NLB6_9BACT|nr:sensor histidine kinase [Deminuibacter soli]RFM28716.1 sensor histidine kinase [Deminuibacter soli]
MMRLDRGIYTGYCMFGRQLKRWMPACALLLICLFPLRLLSQYYPAPRPVAASQLQPLLRQVRSANTPHEHIRALNALGNLYINLPLRKPVDFAAAKQYLQQALTESTRANDTAGKTEALLLLGQLAFFNDAPEAWEPLLPQADDATRAKLLLQLSFYYWYRDAGDSKTNLLKSIEYAKQAGMLGEKLGLKDLAMMAERNIAMDNSELQKPGAEAGLLKVLDAYKRTGYRQLHYIYFVLAWHYYLANKMDKAYYYSETAINSVLATKDTLATGDMYVLKSEIGYHRDSYEEAIRSAETALRFFSYQSGMYYVCATICHDIISSAYDKLGRRQEAIEYILKVMHQYPPRTTIDSIAYIGRLGDAYRELKEFDKAEKFFLQKYAISKRIHSGERSAAISLGHMYLDAKAYEKARVFLYQALSFGDSGVRASSQRYLHYMIYLADSATRRYASALKHLSLLNNQAAADARLEQDKVVKQMEVAYRAREKEQELKLKNQHIAMLQHETDAQREKLKQSQKIGMLTAGGLLLAVAVGVLLFFLYRQKKRGSRSMFTKNQQLQKLVSEKEWLLKEVHHRVKNNLHTIFCLLESQARTATPEARAALEKSRQRIYAMSLFHKKVYQSDNIETVDLGNYIREFLLFLQDGFDLEAKNIRIVHDMDPVPLPLRLAMPLALVANEALTNAAKYAFKGRLQGEIRLALKHEGDGYVMMISDNGIGMPEKGTSLNRSLGMELMYGLCADIGAEISFRMENGTQIRITFTAAQEAEL